MIRRPRLAAAAAAITFALLTPARGLAADVSLRGVAVDCTLEAAPPDADTSGLPSAPMIVRLSIDPGPLANPAATLERLRDRLAAYKERNIQVVLALGSVPAADADVEPWRQFIRAVAEQGPGKTAAYQVGAVQGGAPPDVNRYVFLLKLAAVQIRSADSGALVFQGSVPATETEWLTRVFAAGTAAYVDGVALDGPATDVEDDAVFQAAVQRMTTMVEREKPSAKVLLGPIRLPGDTAAAISALMNAELHSLGTPVLPVFTGEETALKAALTAASRFTDLIASDLVTLDDKSSDLQIHQGAATVTSTIGHRLLYSLSAFATYLVYWSPPGGPLDVELTVANAAAPAVRDPLTGASEPLTRVQRGAQPNRLRATLPAAGHPLVVDFTSGNSGSYGSSVDVQKEALPRVEEIIFRHQQAQAAQDAVLQNYIAHVRIEQHFHPSPADPAYNLITENRLFSDHGAVEWEELSFELNGAKWTANRPAFPLVQPEKVLSLPLDLRLNRDYAYRLAGIEMIGERPAFVVRFDPVDTAHAFYRGTVWIDRATFVRLKVSAVETKLSGPIVSNDETQIFEPAGSLGGRPMWLLSHLSSKQIFLIAGRSVLIERELRLSDFSLNASNFDREREAARTSSRIMYRDTDKGVRYLVKQGDARVVSDRMTSSAKAIVMGADIDPSFDRPLPIVGLDIVDFNFLNRNLQLALLYGGVLAFGNIQRANLWGGKFDASVDFSGIALKSNDDLFDSQGKRAGERVNKLPAGAGVNLGFQFTPFQKVSAHYELKYDAYSRDDATASTFVIPSNTATTGEGIDYEYRRRGYSLLANAETFRRSTWNAWSQDGGFDARDRTYTTYDLGLSKDFILATFHTIHLSGTYFGGDRLDRFSEYQFGLFDATRMHGVPASVRFAELAMFRGSYSFNLFDQYRLDLFFDHATGRDPQVDNVWRQVTGTGARVNFRTPRNTVLQVDFGKSVLPDVYRGAGSMVLQIMLLKPL